MFNIASCENYMAYWDNISPTPKLYIYNIPNDFTKISSYEKVFDPTGNKQVLLDINKNGVCFYLIDNKIGLFSSNNHDVSLVSQLYDSSFTRLAIKRIWLHKKQNERWIICNTVL